MFCSPGIKLIEYRYLLIFPAIFLYYLLSANVIKESVVTNDSLVKLLTLQLFLEIESPASRGNDLVMGANLVFEIA